MPTLERDGATIYYEEHGSGFPLLLLAPGGLNSAVPFWHRMPLNPIAEFSNEFRVIAMDQRNAGNSSGPLEPNDAWGMYARDQLAVLDHLGIEQCHLYGQCIGGPFIFSLLKAQPQRVACAVIAQTIGRVGAMPPSRSDNFDAWVKTLKDHPEATDEVIEAFYQNLYGPGFVYSVDRTFVSGCQTPCLVLAGNDAAHPLPISEEVAKLLPHAEFIQEWKEGAPLAAARGPARTDPALGTESHYPNTPRLPLPHRRPLAVPLRI